MKYFFFEKIWRTSFVFLETLVPLIQTSGDICLEFQSQSVSPHLHALLSVCDELHRRIFGMTSE